jgi:hypothetical protein
VRRLEQVQRTLAPQSDPSSSNILQTDTVPTNENGPYCDVHESRDPTTTTDASGIAPNLIEWANTVFARGNSATTESLTALLQEASDAARNDYDESSARAWAKDNSFQPEYIDNDRMYLEAHGHDFVAMARHRLETPSPNRLNHERISKLRSDNLERELLSELASGMWVPIPEGFVPNGQSPPSPLPSTYGTPLNIPEMSDAAALHYGAIMHPTIENISQMVSAFWKKVKAADPHSDWSNLRLWNMDLRGA